MGRERQTADTDWRRRQGLGSPRCDSGCDRRLAGTGVSQWRRRSTSDTRRGRWLPATASGCELALSPGAGRRTTVDGPASARRRGGPSSAVGPAGVARSRPPLRERPITGCSSLAERFGRTKRTWVRIHHPPSGQDGVSVRTVVCRANVTVVFVAVVQRGCSTVDPQALGIPNPRRIATSPGSRLVAIEDRRARRAPHLRRPPAWARSACPVSSTSASRLGGCRVD